MELTISNPFTLQATLTSEHLNLYTWFDKNGLRLTIETDQPDIRNSQRLVLLFTKEQAGAITKLIRIAQEEPQTLKSMTSVG